MSNQNPEIQDGAPVSISPVMALFGPFRNGTNEPVDFDALIQGAINSLSFNLSEGDVDHLSLIQIFIDGLLAKSDDELSAIFESVEFENLQHDELAEFHSLNEKIRAILRKMKTKLEP